MNATNHLRTRRTGFTLMEVLLVLVILVILAGMATIFIRRAQQQANVSAAQAQIGAFKKALELYQVNIQMYPSTEQGLQALIEAPADLRNVTKWKGPYLDTQPLPKDPWDNEYAYQLLNADQFQVWSVGPDGQPDTEDDVRL